MVWVIGVKLECKAFPMLSTMADVVIDDSMQAAIASSLVTSFLNMSLACAAKEIISPKIPCIRLENRQQQALKYLHYLGPTVSSFQACKLWF